MDLKLQIYNQETSKLLPIEVLKFIRTLDIYYQPEFLACDAKMQNGTYEIAVYTSGTNIWVYPYIVLPIKETAYFDISSPYGYAGPVATSNEIQPEAEQLFVDYIRSKQNIATEFVRYHHIYNENNFFQIDIKNLLNRRVVVLETKDQDDIWMNQFSGTNRNLVRKLEKEGFTWSVKPFEITDIEAFDKAYRANMVHSGAGDFYFFTQDFYAEMIEQLGEKLLFAKVERDGETYASALFFVSGKMVTYYLSARNLDHPKVPGSNLLLSKMAFWSQENGMKLLNFGGGLSLDENDFLFKFKSNFGKQIKDFTIGKRVHQPAIYKELQEKFIARNGEEAFQKVKHILQFYA
jgi:hypothetical protein